MEWFPNLRNLHIKNGTSLHSLHAKTVFCSADQLLNLKLTDTYITPRALLFLLCKYLLLFYKFLSFLICKFSLLFSKCLLFLLCMYFWAKCWEICWFIMCCWKLVLYWPTGEVSCLILGWAGPTMNIQIFGQRQRLNNSICLALHNAKYSLSLTNKLCQEWSR